MSELLDAIPYVDLIRGLPFPARVAVYAFCSGVGAVTLTLLVNAVWEHLIVAPARALARWWRRRAHLSAAELLDILRLPVKAVFPTPPWAVAPIPVWCRPLEDSVRPVALHHPLPH